MENKPMPATAAPPDPSWTALPSRRDYFAAQFGAGILQRNNGRKADALAREVIMFTDAFLAELDKPRAH